MAEPAVGRRVFMPLTLRGSLSRAIPGRPLRQAVVVIGLETLVTQPTAGVCVAELIGLTNPAGQQPTSLNPAEEIG